MSATGGLLLAIGLLALAVLVPRFHRSDPPRWTTRGWVGEVVTVSMVCVLALGLVYFGAGVINAVQTGPQLLDLAALAVVLIASIMIWRRLRPVRQKATEPAATSMKPYVSDTAPGGTAKSPAMTAREPPPPHKAA